MKTVYVRVVAILLCVAAGLSGGLMLCRKCSKSLYEKYVGTASFSARTTSINDIVDLNGNDPDKVCEDLSDILGDFRGLYSQKATLTVKAETDKKSIKSVAWIEDRHLSDSFKFYALSEGKHFSDAAVDGRYEVVVGGEKWAKSSIGDRITITLNNINGEQDQIEAVICGKLPTPAAVWFIGTEATYAASNGIIILPDIGLENYVENPYSKVAVSIFYTDDEMTDPEGGSSVRFDKYKKDNGIITDLSWAGPNYYTELQEYMKKWSNVETNLILVYVALTALLFLPLGTKAKLIGIGAAEAGLIAGAAIFSSTVILAKYVTREVIIGTAILFAYTAIVGAAAVFTEIYRKKLNQKKKGTDNYERLTD